MRRGRTVRWLVAICLVLVLAACAAGGTPGALWDNGIWDLAVWQ